jgi:biopolymer transport protein TolQ
MESFLYLAASSDPGLFEYFLYSNWAGRIIILILALGSVIAWTVMVAKGVELRMIRAANLRFERNLRRGEPLLQLDLAELKTRSTPYATLTVAAIQAYFREHGDEGRKEAAPGRTNPVETALQRVIARQTFAYESRMVMLASIVTGAPFLGLLGTVWGVMDAFGSVALAGSATLQSLAPGVSGALLTTVAGLVVAIPSVFGYNFLLTRIRQLTMELENFASSVADRIELETRP